MDSQLTHIDHDGNACMVDVGDKLPTDRMAEASCEVLMDQETLSLLKAGALKKGDAFTVAKVAGIMAAKKTSDLIPMCHPLPINDVKIEFEDLPKGQGVKVKACVGTHAKTGVEMEALTAASIAALTLYDMAKAHDPGMVISELQLIKKRGGKSDFDRKEKVI